MEPSECRFCKIVNDKKRVFRETKNTVTFLSNPSLVKGHALVVPKKHYENISDIPQKIRHELIDEASAVQRLLVTKLKYPGCDISQHNTPFVPENRLKVHHIHFHVIPRCLDDDIYRKVNIHKQKVFRELNEKELKNTEKLLS